MSEPFAAQRAPDEIEEAQRVIREGPLFAWLTSERQPSELTDQMIADAENALRVRLPASLLAILKMQNGGFPAKCRFDPGYVALNELCGIAPGCTTPSSLQEMPVRMWSVFEGYLSDALYQQWRDTFKGDVHTDWGREPRLPETILLLNDEGHWGIGLNYLRCGRQGEPSVVHVEMEGADTGEEILTEIAPDFLTFLRMLYVESEEAHSVARHSRRETASLEPGKRPEALLGWAMVGVAALFAAGSLGLLIALVVPWLQGEQQEPVSEVMRMLLGVVLLAGVAAASFWVARRLLRPDPR